MNKTGLFVALGLAVVIGAVFGFYPELDLRISSLFYDPASKTFPVQAYGVAQFARTAAMWLAWAFAVPAIVAVAMKFIWPNRPLIVSGRAVVFLLFTMLMAAGILTNFTLKTFWGRPRPVAVTQFNGTLPFVPWWDPEGRCRRNCSFVSGEGATAFWVLAPAALAPPAWRPLAYTGAVVFGAATSGLRVAFGGHFFTDVALAGLLTFLTIWLAHGFIYRWASTRFSDARVDAVLTRWAWPGYRWRQRRRGREVGPAPAAVPVENRATA